MDTLIMWYIFETTGNEKTSPASLQHPALQVISLQFILTNRPVTIRSITLPSINPRTMSPHALQPEKPYSIACMGADGIGPEVVNAAVEVLKVLSDAAGTFQLDFTDYDWSSETYKKTGKYIPDGGLEDLKKHDAILFGAVGAPDVPDHLSLWGLRLAICQPFQQYANVRPTRILKGTESPLRNANAGDLDWVIVRENSEGEYAGQGGRSHRGFPWETATEVSIFTRASVERIMRFAFETAQKREKKHLTYVTKSNAQRNGMVMWDEIAVEISSEFPDVRVDKMLVDAMTCRMVLQPDSLDTIVATNLHADILSDLAAALAGSIGIAPTSNLDPTRKHPSMFEPIHGSAFDITGKGVANPVGTFWTAAEMLRWLGEEEAADKLMVCIENVCEKKIVTRDLGGSSTTKEVTSAVCAEIKQAYAGK
jgi:tartrate dehydrogenase